MKERSDIRAKCAEPPALKVIKIGAKVVCHAGYLALQMAERTVG